MNSISKSLLSISPVDGRYSKKTTKFQEYFSEYALIKYRVYIEIKYFIALSKCSINPIPTEPDNLPCDTVNLVP